MELSQLDSLNEQFALPGHVRFAAGPGGLATVWVENAFCTAAVTLAGGHVMSYHPKGQPDWLWMSPNSLYTPGEPLRGGIPLCWPWFGPHPDDLQDMPKHGFVRALPWSVKGTQALADGSSEVSLILQDTPQTQAWWPNAFALELVLTFGADLHIDLGVRNPGQQPFTYTGAFHHYFRVADVRKISVSGLEDCDYLDKVDQMARKHQVGAVTITGQTDRIYLDTQRTCVITDPGLGRKIHIAKTGSRTTVVWNPAERAALLPDVGAGNEGSFVCVETANAADDIIEVLPGAESHLAGHIWVEQAA